MTRQEIEERLIEGKRPIVARDEHFATAKPRDILVRVITNLMGRATEDRDIEAMYRYCDTILSLNPTSAEHRAMRFEISAITKRLDQARADADWLIKQQPDGINLERVEGIRNQLGK